MTTRRRSAVSSDEGDGKPEPSDYGRMGARQRLRRDETLFRGSPKPPKCLVPCTPRGEQVCSSASTAEGRLWLTPWLRCATRLGPWPGDCFGSASFSGPRLPRWLLPGGEVPGLLFERRLFLGLVVDRTAEGWGRHAQRDGQLRQGELGGPKVTAAFLDVVDGHGR